MKTIPSSSTGATRKGEHNDCVVRAISNVTGKPYDEIHALLKKHGRKDCKSTNFDTTASVMKELGYGCTTFGSGRAAQYFQYVMNGELRSKKPRKTLSKLVADMQTGKYVVFVRGHATALVNGCIIDTFDNNARKEVICIFYDKK